VTAQEEFLIRARRALSPRIAVEVKEIRDKRLARWRDPETKVVIPCNDN